ncbi:MAG TPA: formyltransferase, partial [Caldimonas sp.]
MRAVVFAHSNVGDRCLRVLRARGVEVPLVVTHRDHPGETIWFERVADTAAELGLPVIYGDDPEDPDLAAAVARARPDFIFSFYYRAMIPAAVLGLATRGAF